MARISLQDMVDDIRFDALPDNWNTFEPDLTAMRIEQDDSFLKDRFPDLKADYILANPPFNMKRWGGEHLREDKRWKYGVPPAGNANFAWVQHMIHHLAPTGLAGFVLEGGSVSSGQSGKGKVRKRMAGKMQMVNMGSTYIPAARRHAERH